MNEFDLSDAGALDLSRDRDAQATPYTARHTDVATYLVELVADFDAKAIADNFVRVAIRSGPATVQELFPDQWLVQGRMVAQGYVSKHITSSYFARGALVELSVHCGIAWAERWKPTRIGLDHTRRTALALSQAGNRLASALMKLTGLRAQTGFVAVQTSTDPWLAHYLTTIEPLLEITCATCDEAIYYANNQWRHASTKRAEVATPGDLKKLHHLADPIEEGRKI